MAAGRLNEIEGTHRCRLSVTKLPVAQFLEQRSIASLPVPFSPTLNYTISFVYGLTNCASKSSSVSPQFIVRASREKRNIYPRRYSPQLMARLKSGPPV